MKLLLQSPLKNFLEVVWSYPRYLEGRPRSELYNGNKIMAIRRTNHFLLFKTFIPTPKCRIWKSLLYIVNHTKCTFTQYNKLNIKNLHIMLFFIHCTRKNCFRLFEILFLHIFVYFKWKNQSSQRKTYFEIILSNTLQWNF